MDLNLSGKRVLVTGSTAGLGEAIAKLLAAEGATVVVHGRSSDRAEAVAAAITVAGGHAEVALGDLATDAGANAVVAKATEGGTIDILVNNAGYYHHLNWRTALPDKWMETYEVNVLSAVRMIQRLVPAMRERGWGRVIQIGGGLAGQPVSMQPDYNASLAARHNLAVSLARDLKDSGVTSNVVAPGVILVPAVRELLENIAPQHGWGQTWEEIERGCVRDMVPNDVGRLGRPEEIAAAVAYLASPYADYVSGATIRVDGGTIRSAF
ncbi:SDR family NAD(P)-dependent oxidoreductase [Burkholderia sp. MS455]|uniref:NAD(P)-dependent dehydrogenase (Short-subunit alcohol dehydrogenase family) n=1 Tax=Burkholderia pyrrocinia TaxID=60550 RepID=A0A318IJY2_BURPY|nr:MULTISPECIES: SDR family NAD(P)-dependent oxidoreductase [Burkholderia]PXX31099.1 NAD(P)-dependent dehydrogenase (short-subunit alcohol dehydrogenase family) [Burkholderia pyrrocinia]QRR07858.1 SDR family NAD(P)-dependent oxidoreductase [Burkholderia sp. MS455]SFW76528.1 NAD(P)-dependent dehydrogenase, short-chain alcohol dehydrogenase family [Burkholderia sp. NFACC33-1]SFY41566.1 NAD(P)-dependent dehydrogenase, short-chain alcohol dehydrogenase family [Burkholderia sp. NFPP32]